MDRLDYALAHDGRKREASTKAALPAKARVLLASLVRVQARVAGDPSRRIAVRCPRRAGKTTVVRARLMFKCLTKPNANCLYIALTRPKAEELMWMGKSGLKSMAQKLGLREGTDIEFHNAKLIMTFSNGSAIHLAGASTKDEIDKFRGPEYDEIWIDEAKSYAPKLFKELLEEALEPALITRDGTLGMIGTPGNLLKGKFYEITRVGSEESVEFDDAVHAVERERKHSVYWSAVEANGGLSGELERAPDLWSFHSWTLRDNTAEPHQWMRALRIKAANGWTDRTPQWRREYLGEWQADDTDSVYKFRLYNEDGEPWNFYTSGPATHENPFGLPPSRSGYEYVYGLDLGAADPFAIVILAYSSDSHNIYQAYEYAAPKKANFTSTQIGELLTDLINKTGYPQAIVSDHSHLGGSILQEIANRFGILIEGAPRGPNEKLDAIELCNGDLIDGRLKLFQRDGVRNGLMDEFLTLQWDETGQRENKAQSNHLADACIYARVKAMHHLTVPLDEEPPAPGTQAHVDQRITDEERRAAEGDEDELVALGAASRQLLRRRGR